jgi:hypothetical protein
MERITVAREKRVRVIDKLSPLADARLGKGDHGERGGLYLRVNGNGRSWAFRFKKDKPPR